MNGGLGTRALRRTCLSKSQKAAFLPQAELQPLPCPEFTDGTSLGRRDPCSPVTWTPPLLWSLLPLAMVKALITSCLVLGVSSCLLSHFPSGWRQSMLLCKQPHRSHDHPSSCFSGFLSHLQSLLSSWAQKTLRDLAPARFSVVIHLAFLCLLSSSHTHLSFTP